MHKYLLSLVVLGLTVLAVSLPHKLMAQGKNFNNVVPFGTATGRVGFFDQNSGKIYIYDNNVHECVFTGHLTDLGSPISASSTAGPIETTTY